MSFDWKLLLVMISDDGSGRSASAGLPGHPSLSARTEGRGIIFLVSFCALQNHAEIVVLECIHAALPSFDSDSPDARKLSAGQAQAGVAG